MATIGDVARQREARLFVGREAELSMFRRWLETSSTEPELLNVSGPGGVGKSTLVRAFTRIAVERGRAVVTVDGQAIRPVPEALLGALGGDHLDSVTARLNAERPLLVFDTFEQLGGLTRYLQEDLLPHLDIDVRVVVSGRYSLSAIGQADGGWPLPIRPLRLEGFASGDARAYLMRRGVTGSDLTDTMLRAAGGHPLALALAADLVTQFGARDLLAAPEWHLAVGTLVERLLRDVNDPHLRVLLEAAAMVRQFDETTLRVLTSDEAVASSFDRLRGLAMVRPTPHGLMLHDDARRILADDLRWRDPTRHAELRRHALAYYRNRLRAAQPDERERLFADRLFQWEHGVIQALLFEQGEPGQVWAEPGRREDHDDVLTIWSYFLEEVCVPRWGTTFDPVAEREYVRVLLAYPDIWLQIVRDWDSRAVGFAIAVPLCQQVLPALDRHPLGALVRVYWSSEELLSLPESATAAYAFYLIYVAHGDWKPEAVNAALLREILGLLARNQLYLTTTPFPHYKELLGALGFESIPGYRVEQYGQNHAMEGYVLDLRGVGMEAWLDAITTGRRTPRSLRGEALEQALRDALSHWHENEYLAACPLAELAVSRADDFEAVGADAVRQAINAALETARARSRPEQELAYRAIELAYIQHGPSHERVAERLAVSRATLFRPAHPGHPWPRRRLAQYLA